MKTLEETFAAELHRLAPSLTAPEVAAHVAAACAIGSHVLSADGRLVPASRNAVAQATFLPRAFVHGISREAAATAATPAERTLRFLDGIGTDLDSALGLNSSIGGDVADAVRGEISAMDEQWAKTAERLGLPGAKLGDVL